MTYVTNLPMWHYLIARAFIHLQRRDLLTCFSSFSVFIVTGMETTLPFFTFFVHTIKNFNLYFRKRESLLSSHYDTRSTKAARNAAAQKCTAARVANVVVCAPFVHVIVHSTSSYIFPHGWVCIDLLFVCYVHPNENFFVCRAIEYINNCDYCDWMWFNCSNCDSLATWYVMETLVCIFSDPRVSWYAIWSSWKFLICSTKKWK